MASVRLRAPLASLAGSNEVEVDGSTVAEVLRALERRYPRLTGWVTDEQGALRRHVALWVNDRQAALEDPVGEGDRIYVIPAISGGGTQ